MAQERSESENRHCKPCNTRHPPIHATPSKRHPPLRAAGDAGVAGRVHGGCGRVRGHWRGRAESRSLESSQRVQEVLQAVLSVQVKLLRGRELRVRRGADLACV